ncbi:hypothetical protein DFH09DRAFT_1370754 [Mycena vulgaris]|nr:hypothetical protein DFH09DRAFT_1370754 [Mycena vulgaris]
MSPPPSPSAKKPPHKKRHTKPCRYFQTGRCPHAAQEDCDFAHVYSDQPSLHAPKQCRYYLQGICTNGIWCQYRHGESEDTSLVEDNRNENPGRREFEASPNTLQMRVGVVPPAVYIPGTFNGMYVSSPSAPWSPYTDGFHSPLEFAAPAHFFAPSLSQVVSPASSFDSIDCATPSSSPTSSVSDEGVPLSADDPSGTHYSYFNTEPQAAYLSSPYAEDHFPRYSSRVPLSVMPTTYGLTPLYDIFSPKAPPSGGFYASAGFPPQPEPPRTPINRTKLINYRTKPCRYFKPGSVCPSGDACTFIHADPETISESPSPSPSPVKLQHELPSKPLSAKEENTRKGYFPISWRVIGGGVLMGGAKGDHALSDDADSELSEDSFDGRADPVSRVLELEIPASAPPSAVDFPSTDADMDEIDSMTPTGLPVRARASSIPSTPMTTHVDVFRLFSAESPGGL